MRLTPAARVGLLVVIVAALWLRVWNISAGIPHDVHQDEPQIANRAVAMLNSGDFNPRFFDWPSLTIYLHTLVGVVTFMGGAMRGAWNNLSQFSPDDLFLAGRVVTAFIGAATVLCVFFTGRRFGVASGFVAAALLAVLPAHVRESRLMLADVPAGFFVALSLLLSMRAWERPTWGRLLAAAAAVGLAASSKYNGVFALVFPLIAVWGGPRHAKVLFLRTLAVCGVAAAAFLVTTPYAIFNLPGFLNDYARLSWQFAQKRPGEPGWILYYKYLSSNLSWPAFALLLLGLLVAAKRTVTGPQRAFALMLVVFLPPFFWVMGRSYQIYGRYLIVVYPAACVAVGLGAAVLWSRAQAMRPRTWPVPVAAALLMVAVGLPAAATIAGTRDLARPSTAQQAWEWVRVNVPKGTVVIVEDGVVRLPPGYHTRLVGSLGKPGYDVKWLDEAGYIIAGGRTFEGVLADPGRDPELTVQYRRVLGLGEEVAAFDPTGDRVGPRLRIYKLKR